MSLRQTWPVWGLLLLLALAYGPTLVTGGLLAVGDGLGQYLPFRSIAAATYLHGELPFWNPFNFSGLPMLAAFQGGVFFPGNAAFLLLPPVAAMNLSVLLGYFVAGLATYAYARSLELPRAAAFLAGVTFMGGGYMVSHLEHLTMLHAAGLLPAMLWAVERHATTRRMGYALALAPLTALQLFAGYPQTSIISLMLVGLYALWRDWRRMLPVGLGLGLGLGLAAVQLGPSAALLAASSRGQMSFAELVATSLPPRQLASLLFPFLFGAVPSGLYPTPYWGAGTWQNEITGYTGLVPLALGVAALGAWRVKPAVRFWTPAGVVLLLLSLGGATPLYRLWAMLPVLKIVRVPGRHLLEVDLAVAILAACGFAWLLEASAPLRKRWAYAGGGTLLALVAVGVVALVGLTPAIVQHMQPVMPAGIMLSRVLAPSSSAVWVPLATAVATFGALAVLAARPDNLARALVLGVTLADLGLFGQCYGWRQLCPHPAIALALPMPPTAGSRSLAIDERGYPFNDFDRMVALNYPELSALWGISSVGGYEPMLTARYGHMVGGMQLSGVMSDFSLFDPGNRVLDLLGCRELRLSPVLLQDPAWPRRLASPRWSKGVVEPLDARFENLHAMPLVWRAASATALDAAGVEATIAGRRGPFAAESTALLDDGPAPTTTPGSAHQVRRGFDHLTVETDGAGPGLVVVSEGYDAGWSASDATGKALTVRRVDGLVLGVEVPAGLQRIKLAYAPPRWGLAVAASGASLALVLLWAAWLWLGRRRAAARA